MADFQWIPIGEELFTRASSPKNYVRLIQEDGQAFLELKIRLKSRDSLPRPTNPADVDAQKLKYRSTSIDASIFADDADISIIKDDDQPNTKPCKFVVKVNVLPKVPHTVGFRSDVESSEHTK